MNNYTLNNIILNKFLYNSPILIQNKLNTFSNYNIFNSKFQNFFSSFSFSTKNSNLFINSSSFFNFIDKPIKLISNSIIEEQIVRISYSYSNLIYYPTNQENFEGTYLLSVNFSNCNNGAISTSFPIRIYSSKFYNCGNNLIDGGAIYSDGPSVLINSCSFKLCISRNGGGVYSVLGSFDCFRCEFYQCTATLRGGGIYHSSENTAYIVSSLFYSNNTANQGNSFYLNSLVTFANLEFCRFHFNNQSSSFYISGFFNEYRNTYNSIEINVFKDPTKTFTRSPSISATLKRTPIETPQRTPQRTPIQSPLATPIRTPIISPIRTLQNTPIKTFEISPINTPMLTPLISTPIRTPNLSPIRTPISTISVTIQETYHYTPIITMNPTLINTLIYTPINTPLITTPLNTFFPTNSLAMTLEPTEPLLTWDSFSVGLVVFFSIIGIIGIVVNCIIFIFLCKPHETNAKQIV